jgi:hypothetical protein
MANLQTGKNTYTINLSCDAPSGGGYDDCAAGMMVLDWSGNFAAVAASVTIQGAKGCEGVRRPVLSGVSLNSFYFIYVTESATRNTKVDFKLINLVLDGQGQRLGVYIQSLKGYISYTQTNVDVVNCDRNSFVSSGNGAGLTLAGVGRATIKGGMFFNNGGSLAMDGGALWWKSGTDVKPSLTVTGVNFTANSAQSGGAVYLYKPELNVSRV